MSYRRIRHVHARPGEWVKVHRQPSSEEGTGCGCLVLLAFLLFILAL